jgi:hypothetical protein
MNARDSDHPRPFRHFLLLLLLLLPLCLLLLLVLFLLLLSARSLAALLMADVDNSYRLGTFITAFKLKVIMFADRIHISVDVWVIVLMSLTIRVVVILLLFMRSESLVIVIIIVACLFVDRWMRLMMMMMLLMRMMLDDHVVGEADVGLSVLVGYWNELCCCEWCV